MTILSSIAALIVGFSLGLLGGGGSILTVPILVYLLGFSPKSAIPISLLIVGLGAMVGAARQYFKGNVHLKAAASFLPSAIVGAWAGAKLSQFLSPVIQMTIFAVLTILAALAMLRSSGYQAKANSNPSILILSAFVVGVLTGVVGVGGGFMIVPVLVFFAGMPMIHAVGTSLLIIAMNSLAGFIGYLGVIEIPWMFALSFAGLVMIGIMVGVKTADHIDNNKLKKGFSLMLLVVGGYVIFKTLFI